MGRNIALVMGSFHRAEIEQMLDEARTAAAAHRLTVAEEVWVPGSMEKPLALKRLLLRDDIDGAAALGVIENGETIASLGAFHRCLRALFCGLHLRFEAF